MKILLIILGVLVISAIACTCIGHFMHAGRGGGE